MSTNSHFSPPGTSVYSGEVIPTDPSSVGASSPRPAPEQNQAGYQRDPASPVPSPPPDSTRNDHPVPEAPEPPPWTDEDYVRYAEGRFGHKFSPSAARAFSDFDPTSHDIQAAEFYRYTDDIFDKYGYF